MHQKGREEKAIKKHSGGLAGGRMGLRLVSGISAVLLLFGVSFAWYTFREREAKSREREVMEPYCLYLRDAEDKVSAKLDVDNLIAGETKKIPFSVSNAPNSKIDMGGGNFDFTLELIHTGNLPLTYTLYELEQKDMSAPSVFEDETALKKPLQAVDITKTRWEEALGVEPSGIVNRGTYLLYEKAGGAAGEAQDTLPYLHLSTSVAENGATAYSTKYFLLEIAFPGTGDFQKYNKEIDMIYLAAMAKQPKPVKS